MTRIPDSYLRFLGQHPLTSLATPFGVGMPAMAGQHWEGPVPHVIYPPVGFLPWSICEPGNGDYYGYYWPVGKEFDPPVVALMSHDCGALIPMASSIEALVQLEPWQRDLASLCPEATAKGRRSEAEPTPPAVSAQLTIDPYSPFYLVANADQALGLHELDLAQEFYLKAVKMVPEYTAAHIGLVTLYRRWRKPQDAVQWMLEAIRSPLCFQGASFWAESNLPSGPVNRNDYRRKCLHWLRQTREEHTKEIGDDPLFRARDKLSFATGVTTNDDFPIYEQAIEEYSRQERGREAICLAMLFGELMWCEATPFGERYGLTEVGQQKRLFELCNQAGFPERANLLRKTPGWIA